VLLHPERRSPEVWRAIGNTFTDCFLFSESRGRDASGVAIIWANGICQVLKMAVPASSLVAMDGYGQLLERLGDGVICILGHTRKPTKGSPELNANNHPIRAGHVIGVHNGVIQNDDDLFKAHRFTRSGQVDSEVIFRLLDAPCAMSAETMGSRWLEMRMAELEGTFATLSVDIRRPNLLVALRKDRPLNLHYDGDTRALYFSSRYIYLRKAFGTAVVNETIGDDHGYIFDANQLPRNAWHPTFEFPIPGDVSALENAGVNENLGGMSEQRPPTGKERQP